MYTFLNKIILIISFHRSENDSFGSSAWPICIILRFLLYFKVAGFFSRGWCYCFFQNLHSHVLMALTYWFSLLAFPFQLDCTTDLHKLQQFQLNEKKKIPFGTGLTYFSSGLKQHAKSRNSLGMSRTSHWSMISLISGFDRKDCLYFFQ